VHPVRTRHRSRQEIQVHRDRASNQLLPIVTVCAPGAGFHT
jgi:hypothetical protein